MLLPMSPIDALFLLAESREHPMHVGGLQLFQPPDGATAMDVRALFDAAIIEDEPAPMFRKRARRSITTLGQWGWEQDEQFDIEHHVRRNALPAPGRVLELLALCSRLHSTLLDRHRPLWETHLIEGLDDGRYAVYLKMHHALVDGVASLKLLQRQLTEDPDARDVPAPWSRGPRTPRPKDPSGGFAALPAHAVRSALDVFVEVATLPATLAKTISHGLRDESTSLSFSAPKTMFNVPITGARRFAAQSWPISRIQQVGKAADSTLNDVVLAMCSGALRTYMLSLSALPESPLIAMVPVSLRAKDNEGGGNSVGAVMVNLATNLRDPGERLTTISRSMTYGKAALREMSPTQILAMTALGISPLALPMLGLPELARPPFNLIISNVPGPRKPLYWNGARLDGLYPLSIPLDGQALNITCTSYADELAFGLTGCRRSVPHLQRLLGYLGEELFDLERAVGVA
jgi:diacylglycerol O-acyltransferase / wax synthase